MAGELEDIGGDIDYYEPEEDQETDNLEGEQEAPSDDDENQPDEESEAATEDQDNEEDPEGEEAEGESDDPVIDIDGEQVPLSQLKEERMRQQDYSRKTAELSRERETVQQAREHYTQQYQTVNSLLQETVQFLEGVIPDEPPLSLAQSDPAQYQYQKELRARAKQEVQQLVERSQKAQQTNQQTQQFDQKQVLQRHVEGIERRFPHLRGDQQKLVGFVQETRQKAKDFGFTDQEVSNLTDDRIIEALHYAALGKKAEHNRNNAKRRLQQPKKGNARPATGNGNPGNRKAMQRLEQTGSLRDALNIDFD